MIIQTNQVSILLTVSSVVWMAVVTPLDRSESPAPRESLDESREFSEVFAEDVVDPPARCDDGIDADGEPAAAPGDDRCSDFGTVPEFLPDSGCSFCSDPAALGFLWE